MRIWGTDEEEDIRDTVRGHCPEANALKGVVSAFLILRTSYRIMYNIVTNLTLG